jgi:sugar-specific transcriptional regulator TrmB
MEFELLKEIGLTDSEIKVYVALLEIGSSSKGPIVDKSGVASSKIYELLEKLMQKGLVSQVIKSNVKYFEAAPPKRLLDYMTEKKKNLETKEKELETLIPQLEIKRSMAGIESETQMFKGIKGANTAFEDILTTLKKGDELVVLGFSETTEDFQKFLIRFHNKRSSRNIKLRAVFGVKLKKMINEINKMPYSECRSSSEEETPVAYLIYKEKVLFSMPLDNLWIQIKNKRLADSFRLQFEKQWTQLKKIK